MELAVGQRPRPFAALLRSYRTAAGFSQEVLAERARISVNGISALERGIRKSPQSETLALLVDALQLTGEARRHFVEAARGAAPRGGSRVTIAPVTSEPVATLPQNLTAFYGRESEVREISEMAKTHRLVTVVGSGGIGKTRTALEVAATTLDDRHDGVRFIDLAPLADGAFVATAIARACGVVVAGGAGATANLVRQLAARDALLVIDNCEHVIEAAAHTIASILSGCPNFSIIATSRQALGITGERAYRLPSLPMPASVRLFADRAQAANHRFALTAENAYTIAAICRRLDGIPLAIELAAARVTTLDLRQLLERLDDRFHVLTGGTRDALPRQQTLRALIDWSFDLLSVRERELFCSLCIFVGSFTLESAVAIARSAGFDESETFDTLASLVDKSLIDAEIDMTHATFRLLQSTRSYGLEKLSADGRNRASRAHLDFFADQFAGIRDRCHATGRVAEQTAAFGRDLEEIRAALDFASAERIATGAHLLVSMGEVAWHAFGLLDEYQMRIEGQLRHVPSSDVRIWALLQSALAGIAINRYAYERALQIMDACVAAARSCDDELLAACLQRQAFVFLSCEKNDDACRAVDEARSLDVRSVRVRLSIRRMVALMSRFRDDYATARRTLEDLVREEMASDAYADTALHALALLHFGHGQYALAIEIAQRLVASRRDGGGRLLGAFLDTLAALQIIEGSSVDDALRNARESLRLSFAEGGLSRTSRDPLGVIALAYAYIGDYERAAELGSFADGFLQGREREFERAVFGRLHAVLAQALVPHELSEYRSRGARLDHEAAMQLAFFPTDGVASVEKTGE